MKTEFLKQGQKLKQTKTTGISTAFFISHMRDEETDTEKTYLQKPSMILCI